MSESHIRLDTGELLFSEGDEGDTMFVITKGAIEISKNTDTAPSKLTTLGPGEFLGEMSLINNETRSATGTAREPTTLMMYDKSQFAELITTRPSIALRIIERLAQRLRETTQQLADLRADSE